MTIYIPLIGMLWRTLDSYGLDPTDIIPEHVYRPGAEPGFDDRMSLDAFEELLTRAVELVGDPAIGLRAAEQLHPSHLGALGHAWLASSSLRTAIMRSQRFHRMLNEQVSVRVTEPPGVLQVEFRQLGDKRIRAEQVDSRLGSLLHLCRANFGPDLVPAYVCMRRSEPDDPEAWTRYFGIPVKFNAAQDCLALRLQDVDTPLTVSSPELESLLEDIMARYLAKRDRRNVTNQVRLAIMEQLPSGGVQEQGIANRLHLSRRTLRNRLLMEGTSFRNLLREVRKDLVRRYLEDESYSITEISFLMGYADSSSFSRAFKSWFGVTPTECRRSKKTDLA
ncbi:MAG: AraC family transcriptional regulator [Xanthomonadales bacterium]|nr:AraC family transcriptional regulator [Xanthomonadales bacterium]